MKKILLPILALAGWLAVPHANASWAYVPLELRMAGAKYIVVGTIDRVVDDLERNGRAYDIGAIKVDQVLKGPKGLKEVKLMWPGPAPFALSTDIKFRKGQEGVWILYPDKTEKGVFWASYPSDYQQLKALPKVKAKLLALQKLTWSPAVKGLQIGAIVEQSDMRKANVKVKGRPVKALASATVYVVMRNSGKAPTHVVNFPPDKALSVELTGPDGKVIPLPEGGRGGGKLGKYHFLAVSPGALQAMGYGMRLPLITQPGTYKLTLGYANKRDGGKLVKGDVWQGALKGEAKFNVAK